MAGFPGGSGVRNCLLMQETQFNLWVSRAPGEGNVNPLQYSCLENPMDRSLVGYSPRAAEESHRPQGLNNYNIRRNCVLIDWWIWWIWLHQIFLAPWGTFRWDMQTRSPHTGTLCLGRWTLCCGMWALIPWRRTKCWSCPLVAQS